jgi:hypothetical protein
LARPSWFEILQVAAGIIDRWMRKVGFAVELVNGHLYLRVLKPEDLDRERLRAGTGSPGTGVSEVTPWSARAETDALRGPAIGGP